MGTKLTLRFGKTEPSIDIHKGVVEIVNCISVLLAPIASYVFGLIATILLFF